MHNHRDVMLSASEDLFFQQPTKKQILRLRLRMTFGHGLRREKEQNKTDANG